MGKAVASHVIEMSLLVLTDIINLGILSSDAL